MAYASEPTVWIRCGYGEDTVWVPCGPQAVFGRFQTERLGLWRGDVAPGAILSPNGRVDPVHVVVVVEGVEEVGDFLAGGIAEFGEVLGQVADFG